MRLNISGLCVRILALGCLAPTLPGVARADGGVVFENVAAAGGAGIAFAHPDTPRIGEVETIVDVGQYTISEFVTAIRPEAPLFSHGAPGVALLDFDGDGDLDIYATNTAGVGNSLFANQVQETGELAFVDVAAAAGVDAVDLDSTGVCFGDIDNDGDPDLYVLGTGMPNRLFENQGDGTFADVTAASGTGAAFNPTACSMADVDNDGLLDIVVANTYDNWGHTRPSFARPPEGMAHHPGMEHNLLFLNQGEDNQGVSVFADRGALAGLENVSNMAGPGLTGAAFTWALSTADYDLDGDVDILFADNQGRVPLDLTEERGYLRLYQNDGTGTFHEVTHESGLDIEGAWMGLAWGDLDCDRRLDFFATDTGFLSGSASRWFLGGEDGVFVDSRAEGLHMTPFGWGASILDYDNDGDTDIYYHGGHEFLQFMDITNGGVLLQNTGACSGRFQWDVGAVPYDHYTRNVMGMAVGDLDLDGFEDAVSIASFRVQPGFPLPGTFFTGPTGSFFDFTAQLEELWAVNEPPGFLTYRAGQHEFFDGDLAVEIASGNDNNWVEIHTLGTFHLLSGSRVNRDGIGAVVSFTPEGGPTSMQPIVGGSSYASQDALSAHFGLGRAERGTVEVLWPGGVRNRVFDVRAGERLVLPEIPCDLSTRGRDPAGYRSCVEQALAALTRAGVVAAADLGRFQRGAFACDGSDRSLCLHGNRFQVEATWTDRGTDRAARVQAIDERSGLLSFFGEGSPIEIHVNVLNACRASGHYWVFAAASTNVGYTLTVTDTLDGSTRSYTNPPARVAQAITDTSAFATCP